MIIFLIFTSYNIWSFLAVRWSSPCSSKCCCFPIEYPPIQDRCILLQSGPLLRGICCCRNSRYLSSMDALSWRNDRSPTDRLILNGEGSTFEDFVFVVVACLEVEDVVVEFLCDELVLLEAFVCDVKDWVFVSGFVVHVEDYMGLWDWDYGRDISCFRFDSIFAYRNMHIRSVSF